MSKNQFWNDVRRVHKRPCIHDQPVVTYQHSKPKSKFGNFLKTTWEMFVDYSFCSTVHGFKYMGERNRTIFERTWWMVVVIISLIVCGHMITNVYNKFRHNPVIVSFSDKETPIWQIPFPAVTICPQTKTVPSDFNVTQMYHLCRRHRNHLYTMDQKEIDRLTAISQVCDPRIFSQIDPKNQTNCKNCVKNLRKMAIPLNDLLIICNYRKNVTACSSLFKEVVTGDGICYTFNGLNNFRISGKIENRWSLEDGYKLDALLNSYPRRALGAGIQFGLLANIGTCKHDFDFICKGPSQGFKLMLHMPIEYPQMARHFYRIPLMQELIVVVKPKMMITSKSVRDFPVESRKCYFLHERHLRFFNVYTQRNCELECLANFTLKKCGCTKFHMPPIRNVPICGADKIECFDEAEDELLQHQIETKLSSDQSNECNCLPGCNSITYEAEISQADFNATAYLRAHGFSFSQLDQLSLVSQASTRITEGCTDDYHTSRMIIFFKDEQFLTIRRSRMYGPNEFLADCGGLLGLFMGVSFMSFFEVLYFITVRLYFNLKMRQQPKKLASTRPQIAFLKQPISEKVLMR